MALDNMANNLLNFNPVKSMKAGILISKVEDNIIHEYKVINHDG